MNNYLTILHAMGFVEFNNGAQKGMRLLLENDRELVWFGHNSLDLETYVDKEPVEEEEFLEDLPDFSKNQYFAIEKTLERFFGKELVQVGQFNNYTYVIIKDYIQFKIGGHIKSNDFEYLCGYVLLPNDYPFRPNELTNLDVHGGVTFHGNLGIVMRCFDLNDAIGFDCAHAGDHIRVQNEYYVSQQCFHLINQLVERRGDYETTRGK